MLNNSSMFQPGLSQSSVWQWHVRIGCSPDETCGAREGCYEMRDDLFSNAHTGANVEHRISNTECRISKERLSLAYPVTEYIFLSN